jgi:glyoxylase-like metal-dependent hydrolase (beta-lactamase superfamily II)
VPAATAGIHLLPIPTPFAVGTVNAYLIDDDPLTLVDCGPNSATALGALEDLLAVHGRELADVAQVVVTHQHVDHMGLAAAVAQRCGAAIVCLDRLAPYLEDWETWSDADDDEALGLMLRHGVPAPVAHGLRAMARVVRGWGAPVRCDRRLRDGATLRFAGRELRVLHRPGHSPSDTILVDEARGVVIGGDHLLGRISSNAVVSRPLDWPPGTATDARRAPLLEYRASLRATRELAPQLVLGGHGAPVSEPVALIDERLALQDRRAAQLHALLRERPRCAHELAVALFDEVAFTQAFLTLSEVLGHLDLLVAEGLVAEDDTAAVVRFEACR